MTQDAPTQRYTRQENTITFLFMAVVLVIAFGLRFWLIQSSEFPRGEGAFFYESVVTLRENNFIPPETVVYNGEQIQNIYPPGAFYIVGLLAVITGADLFDIFRWYPLVMSTASIFVVYAFFNYYFDTRRLALLATGLFAITPVSIIVSIGGTGVVRATGTFFAVSALYMTDRLIAEGKTWQVVPVSLLVAAACLTQPQSGIFVVVSVIVFMLLRNLEPGTLLKMTIATVIALLIVSIWIGYVVQAHTFAPIWEALFSQLGTDPLDKVLETFFAPDNPGLAQEAIIRVLGTLSLIGIFVCIAKGHNEIVIWLIMVMTLPITTPGNIVVPLSITAAYSIDFLVLTGLSSFRVPRQYNPETGELVAKANNTAIYVSNLVVVFILIYSAFNVIAARDIESFALGEVTDNNEDAMEWIARETPPDSTFYVITGVRPWEADEVSDWFPVLADRFSFATVSGTEWIEELEYERRIDRFGALQSCVEQNAVCLNDEILRLEPTV
ncbi:MAG: hypothetical protein AAF653_19225, partial [Chloroflexota bacterium]